MLGLHRFTENDTFEYNFTDIVRLDYFTRLAELLPTAKSNILKISAMFYGASGMISPITLQFRCLHKYEWDTELETTNVEAWNKII